MFWSRGGCLASNSINFPNFSITFSSFFHNTSYVVWTTTSFNCKHPSNVCAHIPSTLWVSTFYVVFIIMNALEPMMQFATPLPPLRKYWLPCGMKIITCASFNHIQFLSLTSWHCVYQIWHLHYNQGCHYQCNISRFTSPILHNSRICHLRCSSSQGKELSQPTPHWSILPVSNWDIWLLTQTCWCVFTLLSQCHLEVERQKVIIFPLWSLFFIKNFNHITKDISVFHFKVE